MEAQILIVAADDALRRVLADVSPGIGARIIGSAGPVSLSRFFENRHPDLVVIGPSLQHPRDAVATVRLVRQWTRRVPIVLVTAQGSEELAVAAMRAGVTDYFRSPLDVADFAGSVRRLIDESVCEAAEPNAPQGTPAAPLMVGRSPEAVAIRAAIQQIAATDSTVLITGETGTGKELAALLIHQTSRRSRHAFVSINCAAIPESLFESELFGYERGSFTGAGASRAGRLSAAHRGTVLFDEVGDMTPAAQAKVLRLVEDKIVTRLGSTRATYVDVRIVAATNQDVASLIAGGSFRRDLYFRLNVARIQLPPLRRRAGDIPDLLAYYLGVARERLRRDVEGFTDDAVEVLSRYSWPGNIRELKNLVERLVIHAPSRWIDAAHLHRLGHATDDAAVDNEAHRAALLDALAAARGNKSEMARALGCSRMTVYRRLAAFNGGPKRGA
jgi:DNA-binding NtrC family response regulator